MMKPRKQHILPLLALLLALAGGWLLFYRETPEAEVRRALDDLVRAVEGHNRNLMADRIHPGYHGWGGRRDFVLGIFAANIGAYRTLGLKLQKVEVEMTNGGGQAVVNFQWSHRRTEEWLPARALFARDTDQQWKLLDLETEIGIPASR